MKIDIPFNIGDDIYTVNYVERLDDKCTHCYGSGVKQRVDMYGTYDVSCSKCDQGRVITKVEPHYKTFKSLCQKIHITGNSAKSVYIDNKGYLTLEYQMLKLDECYTSKEEADKECERRNNILEEASKLRKQRK